MIRWHKVSLVSALTAFVLVSVAPVGAQAPAQPPAQAPAPQQPAAPYSAPYPMGQVTMTFGKVGVGVGAGWGKGVLTYKGKEYTFKVKGISAGAVGVAKGSAKGDVYNLFSVGEFAGEYVAAGAGVAIIKGGGRSDFVNGKGVHIVLNIKQEGLALNIGPQGFSVRLQEKLD